MEISRPFRWWRWLTLTFALLLAAVRLSVIDWCAPLVPFWDEWMATADYILKPWRHGHVSWFALWRPHNDHRIVLTRLWEMAWYRVLGQWDPTVVATANVLLITAAEAAFVTWIARAWPTRRRVLWLIAGVVLLVVPYGYETLLTGFQSQYHFLIALGLVAVCAATRLEDARWAAPVAVVASAVALFTVGAGLLVAVTVGILAVLQSIVRRSVPRRTAIVWVCAVVIFAVGWGVRPPPTFDPPTAAEATLATARYAGWPASNLANLIVVWPESSRYLPPRVRTWPSPDKPAVAVLSAFLKRLPVLTGLIFAALALITFLPGIFLLVRLLTPGGDAPHPAAWALLGVIVWSALNVLGMAVARSGDLLVPPRYQDLLVLGLLANVGALLVLAPVAPAKRRPGWLGPLWIITTGTALAITALGVVAVQLPRKAAESAGARQTVQAYVASGDPALFHDRPANFVPWPGGEDDLAKLLLDPEIRVLLPAELRAPPGQPSVPGRVVRGVLRIAPAVAALAALLFGVLAYRTWRGGARMPASDRTAGALPAA